VDLTGHKSALINFGLLQLSAMPCRNEFSQYKLLGINSLFCNKKRKISKKRLSQTNAEYSPVRSLYMNPLSTSYWE